MVRDQLSNRILTQFVDPLGLCLFSHSHLLSDAVISVNAVYTRVFSSNQFDFLLLAF